MVYIYKKIIGGKPYYYLRLSKRIKNRIIVKDIAYLGNDISNIFTRLDKLPKYRPEIRKAYKHIKRFVESAYYLNKAKELKLKENEYLPRELLEEIEAAKIHFENYFLRLDPKTIENAYKNFVVEFAYNTTSIEGNTITLEETNKLLRDDLTPANKTPREIFDLQNTEKVFFYLINTKPELNNDLIIQIHGMLIDNIDARKGYRTQDIRVIKSHFDASPAVYVKTDMDLLLQWYNKLRNKIHPLVLAVLFHHKFEKIHPFFDGNGRTGRMVLNYILISNGYPPVIIEKKRRSEYIDFLSYADKCGSENIEPKYYKKIVIYIGETLVTTYWNNFNI